MVSATSGLRNVTGGNWQTTTMNRLRLTVAAILSAVAVPLQVAAWNAPTHMVTGSIAYRILESATPRTVSIMKTLLEKHPWYADRWRDNVEKLPESQRGEMLFMLAARWADDICMQAYSARRNGITSTFPSTAGRARRHQTTGPTSGQYSFGPSGEPANRQKPGIGG
jgi:hypothetical protein